MNSESTCMNNNCKFDEASKAGISPWVNKHYHAGLVCLYSNDVRWPKAHHFSANKSITDRKAYHFSSNQPISDRKANHFSSNQPITDPKAHHFSANQPITDRKGYQKLAKQCFSGIECFIKLNKHHSNH